MELGWLSQMFSLVAMAHGSSNLSLSPPTTAVAGWIMANVQVRVMVLPFHQLGAVAVSPVFLCYPVVANSGGIRILDMPQSQQKPKSKKSGGKPTRK